jgi:hypothetical protein
MEEVFYIDTTRLFADKQHAVIRLDPPLTIAYDFDVTCPPKTGPLDGIESPLEKEAADEAEAIQ